MVWWFRQPKEINSRALAYSQEQVSETVTFVLFAEIAPYLMDPIS